MTTGKLNAVRVLLTFKPSIIRRNDEALALTQQLKETDSCLVEATMGNIEWTTKEQHVLKAFADSLAEFGSLYAELAKS